MSYKTYITEALVCGSTASNTSDKSYLLFTKDAGMLWASARSVREERSKQRYALQDFSRIRVSLVKGKSGWRIGSVEAHGNPFMRADSRSKRGLINYVVTQLRRYVHGEIPLPQLYDDTLELLSVAQDESTKRVKLEQLFSLRLLALLGYVAVDPLWEVLIEASTVTDAYHVYTDTMEPTIARAILEGAQASHL